MNRRGVSYDVGTVYPGFPWRVSTRPRLDPQVMRRELQIIKEDLHCNAVRICGRDPSRLIAATQQALALDLEVWLAPALFGQSPDRTLDYYLTVARAAEPLRTAETADRLVFVAGGELSLFMAGIVPGRTIPERLASLISQLKAGSDQPTQALNVFLARAAEAVRGVFGGPLSYASLTGEEVDWAPFDFIGVDHYRDARIKDRYADMLGPLLRQDKPVVVTEVGMRGYRGADDSGTLGFGVIDYRSQLLHAMPLGGRLFRPRLNGDYVRDEDLQARELAEVLGILAATGVDGVFVSTFVEPLAPHHDNPRHDLDMSALSLVKSYSRGHGQTYPDMTWEPKKAFAAVADAYTCRLASICPGACHCLAAT